MPVNNPGIDAILPMVHQSVLEETDPNSFVQSLINSKSAANVIGIVRIQVKATKGLAFNTTVSNLFAPDLHGVVSLGLVMSLRTATVPKTKLDYLPLTGNRNKVCYCCPDTLRFSDISQLLSVLSDL
ncbi:hypothetical protein P9112_012828 [Eukaryota sp. TZLM1-RC]